MTVTALESSGRPSSTALAVFLDGDGQLVSTLQVDAAGVARQLLPQGGSVTVVFPGVGYTRSTTVLGVGPGESLRIGTEYGEFTPVTVNLPAYPGATSYAVDVRCGQGGSDSLAVEISTRCRRATEDLIAFAYTDGANAWLAADDLPTADSYTVTGAWQPMAPFTVSVTDVPLGAWSVIAWVGQRSERHVMTSTNLGRVNPPPALDLALEVTGGGEDRLVSVDVERQQAGVKVGQRSERVVSTTGTGATITAAPRLPWVTSPSYVATARRITWIEDGSGAAAITDAEIVWNGVSNRWRIIGPGDLTSITLPDLPDLPQAPDAEPAPGAVVEVSHVAKHVIDGRGYAELRADFDVEVSANGYVFPSSGPAVEGASSFTYCFNGC